MENYFIDLILFGFIESYICCLVFTLDNNCKSFNYKDVTIIALVNTTISVFFKYVVGFSFYQIIMVCFMGGYFYLYHNVKLIKGILYQIVFIIIIQIPLESLSVIIYQNLFNYDIMNTEYIIVFIILLPSKILEIFLLKGVDKMKILIWGSIDKRK